MSLKVKTDAKKGKSLSAEKIKLNKYLSGALQWMNIAGRIEAHFMAKNEASKVNPKDFDLNTIKEAQDEYKKQLKNYGFKEKMHYYGAANIDDEYLDDSNLQRAKVTAGAGLGVALVAGATAGLCALSGSPDTANDAACVAIGATATILSTPFIAQARNLAHYAFGAKTPEGKEKAAEYVNAKHALMALKQLRKVVEAPVKAAEKEAYKQEVAKYMSMTNPGGMVSPMMLNIKAKETR